MKHKRLKRSKQLAVATAAAFLLAPSSTGVVELHSQQLPVVQAAKGITVSIGPSTRALMASGATQTISLPLLRLAVPLMAIPAMISGLILHR